MDCLLTLSNPGREIQECHNCWTTEFMPLLKHLTDGKYLVNTATTRPKSNLAFSRIIIPVWQYSVQKYLFHNLVGNVQQRNSPKNIAYLSVFFFEKW